MRKQYVIGNWKMYGNRVLVEKLLNTLKVETKPCPHAEMVVCPPYIFIDQARTLLQKSAIAWGAQNMASEKEGAFTGEISVVMLHEFGCRYVLLGHSERRTLYGETDEQIAKKFKLAIEWGIIPILCIGETLEQRKAGQTKPVLEKQMQPILILDLNEAQPWLLAYEPVWAIGTGISATPEEAQEAHRFLREQVKSKYPDLAQKLPILYGGSVKPDNARALFQMPDIDGGLIGGASLNAQEFLNIYTAATHR